MANTENGAGIMGVVQRDISAASSLIRLLAQCNPQAFPQAGQVMDFTKPSEDIVAFVRAAADEHNLTAVAMLGVCVTHHIGSLAQSIIVAANGDERRALELTNAFVEAIIRDLYSMAKQFFYEGQTSHNLDIATPKGSA